MADEKKPRTLATAAAAKIPKMTRANMASTVQARAEGKKVAYAFIVCAVDEIMRAMDIVPAWGESFSGICAAKRDAERFLQKAEGGGFLPLALHVCDLQPGVRHVARGAGRRDAA